MRRTRKSIRTRVKGLVSGLDDLLIVDVARKPAGLSADLKAGEAFLTKNEAVSDLVAKGFIPGSQDSGADMLSSEGEVICTLAQRRGVRAAVWPVAGANRKR